MADEIQISTFAVIEKGQFKRTLEPANMSLTMDNVGADGGIVDVGTSEEDLAVTDITTEGWLFLKNLEDPDSSSDYVTYGPKDTTMTAFGRIEPGETHILRLEPGITVRWVASAGTVPIEWLLLED